MPRDLNDQRALRSLFWLAIGNIVLAALLVAAPLWFGPGVQMVSSAMTWAQPLTWAVICALIFQRRFVGLACSTAMCVAIGAIVWLGHLARDPEWALAHKFNVFGQCLSLSIYVIAQAFRFILGWRIALDNNFPTPQPYQFATADLIEWTVSIAVSLSLVQLSGGINNFALLPGHVIWQGLVAIPLALAILARGRQIWLHVFIAVCIAIAATAAHGFALAYFTSLPRQFWPGLQSILTLATCYIVVIAVNAGVVRWLGFRWLTGRLLQEGDARWSLGGVGSQAEPGNQ